MTLRDLIIPVFRHWRRLLFFAALVVIMVCLGAAVLELMKFLDRPSGLPTPPPSPSSIEQALEEMVPEEQPPQQLTEEKPLPEKPAAEKQVPAEQKPEKQALETQPPQKPSPPPRASGPVFQKLSENFVPLFEDDLSFQGLSAAIAGSIGYYEKFPRDRVFYYGSDPVAAAHLIRSLEKFREFIDGMPSPEAIREFIRAHYHVYGYAGDSAPHAVLFTGYYEPLLNGNRIRTPAFRHPVYGRPADLVERDDPDVSLGGIEKTAVGRRNGTAVVPYYTRREISEMAAEALQAPVIAWVDDPVGLFFLHIQGSGKIRLDGGETMNVHYRISNGHPYKSIGKYLIEAGKLVKEEVSMQSIRKYFEDHPDEQAAIFNYNPRYTFFETTDKEPVGCYDIELTPGRSLALDRQTFPAAALAFVQAEKPVVDETGEIKEWIAFSRFFLNQDTGSAIKGPGRADIFWGNGPYAELAAGYMKHSGRLFFLVLKPGT